MSTIAARLLQGCGVSPEPCHLKHRPLANPLAAVEVLTRFTCLRQLGPLSPVTHTHRVCCVQERGKTVVPLVSSTHAAHTVPGKDLLPDPGEYLCELW